MNKQMIKKPRQRPSGLRKGINIHTAVVGDMPHLHPVMSYVISRDENQLRVDETVCWEHRELEC